LPRRRRVPGRCKCRTSCVLGFPPIHQAWAAKPKPDRGLLYSASDPTCGTARTTFAGETIAAAPRGTEFPCCGLKRAAGPAYRKPLPGPTKSAVMRTASAKPVRRRSTPGGRRRRGGSETPGRGGRRRRGRRRGGPAGRRPASAAGGSGGRRRRSRRRRCAAIQALAREPAGLEARRGRPTGGGRMCGPRWRAARGRRVARRHGRRRGRVDRQTLLG